MESSLVSWQFENFSTAELNPSPVSPGPPSPTLYHNGVPLSLKTHITGKSIDMESIPTFNISQSSEVSTRARVASSLLNDLEQLEFKTELNDYGMNWTEEASVNLFEELSEIEFTPSVVPEKTFEKLPQHQLTEYSSIIFHPTELLTEQSSPDFSALTAEFQSILESVESLHKVSTNTAPLAQGPPIAGIPITIIDGDALVPVEIDLTSGLNDTEMENMEIDIDDVNVKILNEDDIEIINESEILDMGYISNHGSPASSVYSQHSEHFDEDDCRDDAAGKILDALLLGDLTAAQAYLPVINGDDSSMCSVSSNSSIEDITSPKPSVSVSVEKKKAERRGRKPGKKLAKGSLEYIKDKSLRKKEQNKTAATRYRQKKKMEVAVILDSEAELQKQNDDLVKAKDDIWKQVLMVRQLLREVIQARKPVTGKPIMVKGSVIPVSKNVVKNRRK